MESGPGEGREQLVCGKVRRFWLAEGGNSFGKGAGQTGETVARADGKSVSNDVPGQQAGPLGENLFDGDGKLSALPGWATSRRRHSCAGMDGLPETNCLSGA